MQKNRSDLIREYKKNNGETPNVDIVYTIIDMLVESENEIDNVSYDDEISGLYLLLNYISFLENSNNL